MGKDAELHRAGAILHLTLVVFVSLLLLPLLGRYLAIRYPLKSRDLRTSRNAGVAIVAIWSLSLLFAGPYLSYYQIVHYHGVPICVPIWEDQRRKILDILTFVFGYLLPVTVVSLAYARTIKFLWTSVDPIERISDSRKAKRKVTKMIVAVAILFCLCWLPHHLVILCFWFGHFPFNRATYVCRLASHCLSYANSCLNPIVYALISKHFRKRFKQVFTCLFLQNKTRKKKKRFGKKVHVVNVGKGFTNSTRGFFGANDEVAQVPEENTRKRDPEGAGHARAWTHQLQDAMFSAQKELLEEESLATAGHLLAMTPKRSSGVSDCSLQMNKVKKPVFQPVSSHSLLKQAEGNACSILWQWLTCCPYSPSLTGPQRIGMAQSTRTDAEGRDMLMWHQVTWVAFLQQVLRPPFPSFLTC